MVEYVYEFHSCIFSFAKSSFHFTLLVYSMIGIVIMTFFPIEMHFYLHTDIPHAKHTQNVFFPIWIASMVKLLAFLGNALFKRGSAMTLFIFVSCMLCHSGRACVRQQVNHIMLGFIWCIYAIEYFYKIQCKIWKSLSFYCLLHTIYDACAHSNTKHS